MVEVMKKVSERYEENVKAVRKVFPGASADALAIARGPAN